MTAAEPEQLEPLESPATMGKVLAALFCPGRGERRADADPPPRSPGRRRGIVEQRRPCLRRLAGARDVRQADAAVDVPGRAGSRNADDHAGRLPQRRRRQLLHPLVRLGRPLQLLLLRPALGADPARRRRRGLRHRPHPAAAFELDRALADDRGDDQHRRRPGRHADAAGSGPRDRCPLPRPLAGDRLRRRTRAGPGDDLGLGRRAIRRAAMEASGARDATVWLPTGDGRGMAAQSTGEDGSRRTAVPFLHAGSLVAEAFVSGQRRHSTAGWRTTAHPA